LTPTGRRAANAETAAEQAVVQVAGTEVAIDAPVENDLGRLRGALIEEHHGGAPSDLAMTHGVVRRIRVATQYRNDGGRAWVPVPGTVRLREVGRVPDGFVYDLGQGELGWADLGVLADLELEAPNDYRPPR
jgi:hypothetical protein